MNALGKWKRLEGNRLPEEGERSDPARPQV